MKKYARPLAAAARARGSHPCHACPRGGGARARPGGSTSCKIDTKFIIKNPEDNKYEYMRGTCWAPLSDAYAYKGLAHCKHSK